MAQLENEKQSKTKMRTITPGKRQSYLEECTIEEASIIMRIRLHMVYAKANYGGGRCRKCGMEEETTEHILGCYSGEEMTHDEVKMEDIGWLKRISKTYKLFDEQYPIKEMGTLKYP